MKISIAILLTAAQALIVSAKDKDYPPNTFMWEDRVLANAMNCKNPPSVHYGGPHLTRNCDTLPYRCVTEITIPRAPGGNNDEFLQDGWCIMYASPTCEEGGVEGVDWIKIDGHGPHNLTGLHPDKFKHIKCEPIWTPKEPKGNTTYTPPAAISHN